MVKNKLILILFFLPLVNALPNLQISPASITQSLNEGQISNTFINLTNTGDRLMTNISFSNIKNVTFSNIPVTLAVNQSTTITVSANAVTMNNQSKVTFYYYSNSTSTPKQHNVSILSFAYAPNIIDIKQGDTIMWKNIDNFTRSVTEVNFSFDYNVASGATQTQQFNAIGTTTYFEKSAGFSGIVNVNSNVVQNYVHNPSLDKTFNIQITRTLKPANVSLDLFTTDFSLNYNEAGLGVLRVNNNNSKAYGLRLNSGWAYNFTSNSFDLIPNSYKIVTFYVIPKVNHTNQTNKTYSIELNLTGTNTAKQTKTMNVFVKYHKFAENITNTNNITILTVITTSQLEALCQQHPEYCPKKTINQTIYKPMPSRVNVTSELVENTMNSVTEMQNSQQRIENNNKESITKTESTFATIKEWFNWNMKFGNQTARDTKEINSKLGFLKSYILTKDILTWIAGLLLIVAFHQYYLHEHGRGLLPKRRYF